MVLFFIEAINRIGNLSLFVIQSGTSIDKIAVVGAERHIVILDQTLIDA